MEKTHNFDGDILWCGPDNFQQAKQFTYDFARIFINLYISRILELNLYQLKIETTSIMDKMKYTLCQKIYMNLLRILKKRMASLILLNLINELKIQTYQLLAKQKFNSLIVLKISHIQRRTILFKTFKQSIISG